jgi:hypothetical protein
MEVSGQLHALAYLTPGKEPLVLTGWDAGWTRAGMDIVAKRKTHASAGNQTPVVQPIAWSLY